MRIARPLLAFLIISSAAAAQQAPQPYPPQNQQGPSPYGQPPEAPPPGAPPAYQQGGPPPGVPVQGRGSRAMEKFRAANTTNDGKLTLQQAQAANLHPIIKNFASIDREHKGYVTVQDIREWRQARRAAQQQQQAAQPPAPPPPPPQQ